MMKKNASFQLKNNININYDKYYLNSEKDLVKNAQQSKKRWSQAQTTNTAGIHSLYSSNVSTINNKKQKYNNITKNISPKQSQKGHNQVHKNISYLENMINILEQ